MIVWIQFLFQMILNNYIFDHEILICVYGSKWQGHRFVGSLYSEAGIDRGGDVFLIGANDALGLFVKSIVGKCGIYVKYLGPWIVMRSKQLPHLMLAPPTGGWMMARGLYVALATFHWEHTSGQIRVVLVHVGIFGFITIFTHRMKNKRPWSVQAGARLRADHLFALESTGSTVSCHILTNYVFQYLRFFKGSTVSWHIWLNTYF